MPLVIASLVFAIALAALPSTEPSDSDEYRQYIEHLNHTRQTKARAGICEREASRKKRNHRIEELSLDMTESNRLSRPSSTNPLTHTSSFPTLSSSPLIDVADSAQTRDTGRSERYSRLKRASSVPSLSRSVASIGRSSLVENCP
nr:hypothetical protein L204_00607 [Cryptococcus depauperatus CBS 7855]